MKKKKVVEKGILILIVLLAFIFLIPPVSAVNKFFTTQELNRTPPMGVSGYPSDDIKHRRSSESFKY